LPNNGKKVIPLPNNEFRCIEGVTNNEGELMTRKDANYREVINNYVYAAEEDVASKAIRSLTGKGPEAKYVKTKDNIANENEE
jgi:hypothetical protein